MAVFELIDEDRQNLNGCTLCVSVSGGKDSTAMALWCLEMGLDPVLVFADTKWEAPQTYDYIDRLEKHFARKIERVIGRDGGMRELVKRKGIFPSRTKRFCTQDLKTKPLARFMAECSPCVNAVGIRAEESTPRALMLRWELPTSGDFAGVRIWRPLLRWKFSEVVEIHRRHGLPPNPLYLEGFTRVGCFPCIFENKDGLRRIAERYPNRVDLIRELELIANNAKRERLGRELSQSETTTFFQPQNKANSPMGREIGLVDGAGMPIDVAVRRALIPNAKGSGSGQGELFGLDYRDEEVGCVRWGICEHRADGWPSDDGQEV